MCDEQKYSRLLICIYSIENTNTVTTSYLSTHYADRCLLPASKLREIAVCVYRVGRYTRGTVNSLVGTILYLL